MKIVIRAPNWLGDVVMSIPLIELLQNTYPEAEMIVLIKPEFADILSCLQKKIDWIPFHKRDYRGLRGIFLFCKKYPQLKNADAFFVLPPSFSAAWMAFILKAKRRIGFKGNFRNWLLNESVPIISNRHRSEEYIYLLRRGIEVDCNNNVGPLHKNYSITIKTKVKYEQNGQHSIAQFNLEPGPFLVINPNSEASSRRLPTEQWITLLKSTFDHLRLVFIGLEKDRQRVEEIINLLGNGKNLYNLAGKTSIKDLFQLLKRSSGMISNDSGPAHLGNLLGIPVCVFFGAGNPANTAPFFRFAPVLIIKNNLDCSPCLKNECPLGTLDCLIELRMDDWKEKIWNFFKLDKAVKM